MSILSLIKVFQSYFIIHLVRSALIKGKRLLKKLQCILFYYVVISSSTSTRMVLKLLKQCNWKNSNDYKTN